MYQSDIDIKDQIYTLLKDSELMNEVTGELSKRKRPLNSTKEDVIISVLANHLAQEQLAYVNVNIYVADDYVKGQYEECSPRLRLLCQLAMKSLEGHHGTFYLHIESQHVSEAQGLNESFINNKVLYKTINS